MKNVLVAYATRMGSTAEIALSIADELTRAGLTVTVAPCSQARGPRRYDAVILGSAVYFGHWQKDAVRYLKKHASVLVERGVWLFQSGPCGSGDHAGQVDAPPGVLKQVKRLGTAGPVTFGGRLDKDKAKGPVGRWVATGALAGDFRDWSHIRAWATDIALQLESQPPRGLSPELAEALGRDVADAI